MFFSVFFEYFGFFSFIGCIILLILVQKELKKQLPTSDERAEMLQRGIITGKEKKKVLRQKTMTYRYDKRFQAELKKALLRQTQNVNKKVQSFCYKNL